MAVFQGSVFDPAIFDCAELVAPVTSALTLTGQTSTLGIAIPTVSSALILSGQTPLALLGSVLTPASSSITLAGTTPTLNESFYPISAIMVLTGQEPTIATPAEPVSTTSTNDAGFILPSGVRMKTVSPQIRV